jgi:murein endopeptidase
VALFLGALVAGSLAPLPVGETYAGDAGRQSARAGVAATRLVPLDRAPPPPVRWRTSKVIGGPGGGRLVRGVRLPYEGEHYFTYDGVLNRWPNRPWRRWGTDRLIGMLLGVLDRYSTLYPAAARVGIGDLSRPDGGAFGPEYGGIGHVSHQNGLDVDIYYPRRDGREKEPGTVRQIDRDLSQALVDLFVVAGAQTIYVGPRTGLRGPRRVVRELTFHDNHMHVRISRRWPRGTDRAPLPIGE